MWRLVAWGVASLQEIEERWSICDLADANEALDARHAVENPPREG